LAKTQWLAFPLTIRKDAPFTRLEITTYLEKNNVQTRPVFTGNILNQPGFKNIKYKNTSGNFSEADEIMKRGFVIGCHHGLDQKHLDVLTTKFKTFLKRYN
jgi:CDP-6-deoxy-D-xylo-4-hexulose-3-dehydrase